MNWQVRYFNKEGEPKTKPVPGNFTHWKEVKRYFEATHPDYKFIYAVKE